MYGLLGLVIEEQRPIVELQQVQRRGHRRCSHDYGEVAVGGNAGIANHTTIDGPYSVLVGRDLSDWLANDMGPRRAVPSHLVRDDRGVRDHSFSEKQRRAGFFQLRLLGTNQTTRAAMVVQNQRKMNYLLDWPRMPAWTKMGSNVLVSGVPERFQPYPFFHFDGTPWIPPEKESSGRVLAKSLLDHETLARMLAKEKTGVDIAPIRLLHGSGTTNDPHYEPAPVSLPIRTKGRLR